MSLAHGRVIENDDQIDLVKVKLDMITPNGTLYLLKDVENILLFQIHLANRTPVTLSISQRLMMILFQ